MSLRTLFVDFNSYFASVEQQVRPELRGVPVAVAPVMAETTCCIALSQEAKRLGLRGGMRVYAARRACRELRVVEARPPLYVHFHHELIKAVDSCAPVERVLSIDEMTCEIPKRWQTRSEATALARRVKETIARRVGEHLRCSIGIAPNTLIAKAACEMQKPDGLVVIGKDELPDRLFTLALRDINGIGPSMERRLLTAGIQTIEQLCATPRAHMRKIWGSVEGERFHDELHGEIVAHPPTQKSLVSHSHVLSPAQRNEEDARAVLHRLLQKAATRLRRIRHLAGGMHLFIEYIEAGGFSAELRFLETQDTIELTHSLDRLWQQRLHRHEPPIHVGVSLSGLVSEENHTPPLFGHSQRRMRAKLSEAIDAINARHGKNAVYFGAAHTALDSAPMRIAFNFVPDQQDADRAVDDSAQQTDSTPAGRGLLSKDR